LKTVNKLFKGLNKQMLKEMEEIIHLMEELEEDPKSS